MNTRTGTFEAEGLRRRRIRLALAAGVAGGALALAGFAGQASAETAPTLVVSTQTLDDAAEATRIAVMDAEGAPAEEMQLAVLDTDTQGAGVDYAEAAYDTAAYDADGQASAAASGPDVLPDPPPGLGGVALMPDPWSDMNHGLYRFNKGLDRAIIAPVVHGYMRVTPKPVQEGVSNLVDNLGEPRTFVNDVLQGRFKSAGKTSARFVINSTIGLVGLFDVATKWGIEGHDSDFGQTLGRYGVDSGPYIFLPLFGPSSVRDGVGRVADAFLDPVSMVGGGDKTVFQVSRSVVTGVDARAYIDDQLIALDRDATDPYATLRSAYSQQRAGKVRVARGLPAQTQSSIDDLPDFGAPPPTAEAPKATPGKPAAKPPAKKKKRRSRG